jgi:hypothetical protein
MRTGGPFPGAKARPGREADYSPPSTAVRQVVRGGPRAVPEEKALQKIVSDTERMKNTPIMSVLKLSLLVGLQHRVDESVLSILLVLHSLF